MIHASSQVQSLHATVVASYSRTLIGSFEKLLKSLLFVEVVHLADWVAFKKVSG